MKNIIITGGGFDNKGAEAMTYISVYEMKKRFPNHCVYVYLPSAASLSMEFKNQFNFEFLGWNPIKFAHAQHNLFLKFLCFIRNHKEYSTAHKIYSNTDLLIDISGYALGSNWSEKICSDFLDNIEYAIEYDIPVYLMPQSFGPFDFTGETGRNIDNRIRRLFPVIKNICAREKEGLECLINKYKLSNVCLKPDIVLNNKEIDYGIVFREKKSYSRLMIVDNSVCIIPNSKVYEFSPNDMENIYKEIIGYLLREGKYVYLMYHSSIDRNICITLKDLFQNNQKVIFLDQDYSCIEFNEIVKNFQFVIGSRFHAIVHALKNGVPCIALGWAVKYQELLEELNQQKFFFDMREAVDVNCIIDAIQIMLMEWQCESVEIRDSLKVIQKRNVFDDVII
ncbi:polysaccharide pyruvyl transferase family protein [Bariatricus sp. HCP28S3_D3]|uniref:polysaccharide pyruvyl transferase family protein n=1 Tax=Bariatricus sp. HCP28S3_D3 TaxID=3438901 RepID=UPI003F8A93A4